MTMAEFTRQLPSLAYAGIDLPVVDETNLDGVWDFHFEVGAPRRARTEEKGGDGARNVEPVDTAGLDAGLSVFAALDSYRAATGKEKDAIAGARGRTR